MIDDAIVAMTDADRLWAALAWLDAVLLFAGGICLGVGLFAGGRGGPRCRRCRTDLRAHPGSLRCPQCDTSLEARRTIRWRRGRAPLGVAVAGIALLVASVCVSKNGRWSPASWRIRMPELMSFDGLARWVVRPDVPWRVFLEASVRSVRGDTAWLEALARLAIAVAEEAGERSDPDGGLASATLGRIAMVASDSPRLPERTARGLSSALLAGVERGDIAPATAAECWLAFAGPFDGLPTVEAMLRAPATARTWIGFAVSRERPGPSDGALRFVLNVQLDATEIKDQPVLMGIDEASIRSSSGSFARLEPTGSPTDRRSRFLLPDQDWERVAPPVIRLRGRLRVGASQPQPFELEVGLSEQSGWSGPDSPAEAERD
jgi:hypothetical protein